jgi:hypothetical protein
VRPSHRIDGRNGVPKSSISLPHMPAVFVTELELEAGHAGWQVQGAKSLAKLMAELRGGLCNGGRRGCGRRRSGCIAPAGGRRRARSIRVSRVRLARLLPVAVQLEPQLPCPDRGPKGWRAPPYRLAWANFHSFRHTWATWMRRAGADVQGLVATENWRDPRSAARYAHAVAREGVGSGRVPSPGRQVGMSCRRRAHLLSLGGRQVISR